MSKSAKKRKQFESHKKAKRKEKLKKLERRHFAATTRRAERETIEKIKKSRGASYKIPLLEDDGTAVWDRTALGQEIARHLDAKFSLGLFPAEIEGIQSVLARHIESEIESVGFKLNDIEYESWMADPYDRAMFLRHKVRPLRRHQLLPLLKNR